MQDDHTFTPEEREKVHEDSHASAKEITRKFGFDPEDHLIFQMVGLLGAKMAGAAAEIAARHGVVANASGLDVMRAALLQAENALMRAQQSAIDKSIETPLTDPFEARVYEAYAEMANATGDSG